MAFVSIMQASYLQTGVRRVVMEECCGCYWKCNVRIYYVKGDTCSLYTILKVQKRASGEKPVLLLCSHPPLALFVCFFFFKMYLLYFLAAVGLHCCTWAFCSCGEWGLLFTCSYSSFVVCGLPIAEQGSRYTDVSRCSARAQ